MYGRSRSSQLAVACTLLAACSSTPPSAMNPSTGTPQTTLPSAGNATTPGSAGTTPAAQSGTQAGRGGVSTAAGSSAVAPSGTAGTTSGTSTAGSGAGPAANSGATDKGNYFVSGAWQGYVWTSVMGMGSTISPMDFAMQTTGMPRCVKGSVAATTDYSGIAILGFNINEGPGSSSAGIKPTKTGIMVDVKENTMSPLRIQAKSGDGTTTWCASLTASGGFVPWSSLNTKCWDGSGTAYNNEPITGLMVLVPGTNMAAVPFDFCVNSLAEADGTVSTGTAGGAAPTAGTGALAGSTAPPAAGSGSQNMNTGGSTGGPVTPITDGCNGHATRYWDCCKPHCAWSGNTGGLNTINSCDRSDNPTGADSQSACQGGPGYMCQNMAPWAVNDKLAYGFAAVGVKADICGRCYQLQFTGTSYNGGADPGSMALGGKTMIVQTINVGGDVASGQFDILTPGGGVGAFNACSSQWGVSSADLGPTYGGFLAKCKSQTNDHAALKSCVMQSCMNVFEAHNLTELAAGCKWFVDWYQVADNPALKYKEVACPSDLMNRGIRRNSPPGGGCLR